MKNSQTKMQLRWWLLVIIMVISFFITWKMDFLNFLIEKDFTKLSFVILGILIISTLSIVPPSRSTKKYPFYKLLNFNSISYKLNIINF